MEKKLTGHDEDIALIFKYLKQLLNPRSRRGQRLVLKEKRRNSKAVPFLFAVIKR